MNEGGCPRAGGWRLTIDSMREHVLRDCRKQVSTQARKHAAVNSEVGVGVVSRPRAACSTW